MATKLCRFGSQASVFVFTPEDKTNKKLEGDVLINRKMCSGYPPFYDDNPFGIYEKILSGKLEWPRHVEMTAKDLVKRLLVQVGPQKTHFFTKKIEKKAKKPKKTIC